MKECKKCQKQKDESEFYKTIYGTEIVCKNCRNKEKYQRRINNRIKKGLPIRKLTTLQSRELLEKGFKYCPTCERVLEITNFSTKKVGTGIASHCRECSNDFARERNSIPKVKKEREAYYETRKLKLRDSKLRRQYGIGLEDYDKFLAKQGYKCIICGKTKEENGKALAVDHDHNTGMIRGLLCNNCNVCVGFLQDAPDIAGKIEQYLKEARNLVPINK